MPRRGNQESEERFAAFVEALVDVIGHADRASPLRDYCTGLLMEVSPNVGDGRGQAATA
jgi:SRSO17 transposase